MTGSKASGSLIAPSLGIHGWFFQNNSEVPVVVHLHIAGFYELLPDQLGQPVKEKGNTDLGHRF